MAAPNAEGAHAEQQGFRLLAASQLAVGNSSRRGSRRCGHESCGAMLHGAQYKQLAGTLLLPDCTNCAGTRLELVHTQQ
jgi:hypothetical protein